MAQLAQVWTVCVWSAVALPVLYALEIQYTLLDKNHFMNCECKNKSCQAVFWSRSQSKNDINRLQFLLYFNNADRSIYNDMTLSARFKGDRKEGMRNSYILKITPVNEMDRGLYFCFLQYPNGVELGGSGIDLRPGETPPTLPPITKSPKKPEPCHCRNRKQPSKGCDKQILWPLVGVLVFLTLVLIGTLRYFSRLPKKCQHRFAKKKQLT